MKGSGLLTRQWPAATAVGDHTIENAALVFSVQRTLPASLPAVWDAIDDDRAWEWLPFPGVGVRYDSAERGVGVVREMGSVHGFIQRLLWVERERFWRYEPNQRITFGVVSGTWIQTLLVREYAEDMRFSATADGTLVDWTIAVTPRFPFRFAKYFPALWRLAYRRVGLGSALRRRVRELDDIYSNIVIDPTNPDSAGLTPRRGVVE